VTPRNEALSVPNRSLTAVGGITVGHAQDDEAATGCTVILGPCKAAVEVYGLATGSRELDALSLQHLVPACDGVLLTGGSAFGLAAADGVVQWLEEQGRGFQTSAARVPIVPAAVIYDLEIGQADRRPDPALGRAAAAAATDDPVEEGRVGAGTGATVGKLLGMAGAQRAGIGGWAERRDGTTVAALAVVNAFGDVRDAAGRIVAGCRTDDGAFLDTARALRAGDVTEGGFRPIQSTTLGVVATDVPLGKRELALVARLASAALARRITPSGTPFDGDIVFALSPGGRRTSTARESDRSPARLLALALRAQDALERAIERSVEA
jgi:L-aminopeptidase/D-esterase-like protein